MFDARPLSLALFFAAAAPGQGSTATVPPVCETLPGNAAVAMPMRWSEGKMQVFVDAPLLPANFVGETITGVRLRRSVLPGAAAYPAITRTVTVRGAFQNSAAAQMIGGFAANRPASHQVLFGPAPVSAGATSAPGAATVVGDEFVDITFTTPLPVTAGTLFLEFETTDLPFAIAADQWADAVWFGGGTDTGMAVAVGDGSCTTRPAPTLLERNGNGGPVAGSSISMTVRGAQPGGLVLCWVGLDPETRGPGPGYLGYGGGLGVLDPLMASCHQWAPMDVTWTGTASPAGVFGTSLAIPGAAVAGTRLAVQAGWLDLSRPVLPLSLSNGLQLVCNSAGVNDLCSTFFFPGDAATSPWGPQRGLMPVLLLSH